MRALVLSCLALALGCDAFEATDVEPPEPTEATTPAAEDSNPPKLAPPQAGEPVDAPAGQWTVNTRHPRLYQLDRAAWSELVMELLSGVVQTAPSDEGLRLTVMGRGSVAEQIGLAPGDVISALGTASPPSPVSLHRAWIGAERANWAELKRRRGETTETIHLWLTEPGRTRKDDLAAALVHVGVVTQDESRRLVDRSMLEALAETTRLGKNDLLWRAFGLPENATVMRVESENVGEGGPEEALKLIAARAGERAFEVLVADGSQEAHLQYEVVEGLVDEDVLEAIRTVPERSSGRSPTRRLFGLDRPSSRSGDDDDDTGIFESKGDNHVSVKAADFEALLNNPSKLARAARIVPALEDGAVVGYKLYGIRPSSLLKQAGFQNGDKVLEVQGKTIGSVDAAMDVFGDLSRGDPQDLRFLVERRGKEIELRIDIE